MSFNIFKQPSVQDLVKDVYVKKALAERALRVVRDVQVEALQHANRQLGAGEVSNCFCELVEAIFLHGLKVRLSRAVLAEMFGISGGSGPVQGMTSTRNLPRPDFWSLVRSVSHRASLGTLAGLDQITSDVGRCRVWIRLTINEGTLASSIECITSDKKALASFYRSSALLRDAELSAVIIRLLSSLSSVCFVLPLNVASLNIWPPETLALSGHWYPPDDTHVSPVMRGVDVDDYFIKDESVCPDNLNKHLPSSKHWNSEDAALRVSTKHILPAFQATRECESLASTTSLPLSIADEIAQALQRDADKSTLESCDKRKPCFDADSDGATSECGKIQQVQDLISELKLDEAQGFTELEPKDERPSGQDYDIPMPQSQNVAANDTEEPDTHQSEQQKTNVLTGSGDGGTTSATSGDEVNTSDSIIVMSRSSGLVGNFGSGWSSPFAAPSSDNAPPDRESKAADSLVGSQQIADPVEPSSYDSILNAYTRHLQAVPPPHALPVGTPELSNMLAQAYGVKTPGESSGTASPTRGSESDCESPDNDDFEFVPSPAKEDARTLALLDKLGTIPREKGLDQQNFECAGCKCSIGMIFGPYKKCALDGHLYCFECMGDGSDAEEHVVPSRIVHNWDLRVHPVCRFNKRFLLRYEQEPLLDIRELNPILYSVVSELATIEVLRRQLGFLRLYLFSCQESAKEQLRKLLWPRDYLYEHVHLYSTLDLLSVPTGSLQKTLERAVQFARKHVLSCHLCRQKGFICELCSDPKVIFPFNMDETHFCERCSALYHRHCMAERGQSCPKCERRRLREQQLARQHEVDDQDET